MDWIFDGGRRCLDFVNTLRDRYTSGREQLTDPALLAEWLVAAGHAERRHRVTAEELALARELREAIDRLARGETKAADVRLVNQMAAELPVPQLQIHADGPQRVLRFSQGPVRAILAELATDAIDLVASNGLVRICASDTCGVRFVDASPKHNRQWCSMARCGNRAKARAHYARRKSST
ncbi:ABATE domain-containing protein [Kibdelosporangium philippinense]|uniref:ABATE domain-containing protein n=1 Tax=Kibdelosporangium philippinense TaxID=211113 RepID=A0ABS8ZTU2_9PSEU|nr:ABATE domain-containing protein [Kibdelosporangium philippinense]MCE7011017.1 ABATE domain-containing protein [Kibdelosporangium philippinense]